MFFIRAGEVTRAHTYSEDTFLRIIYIPLCCFTPLLSLIMISGSDLFTDDIRRHMITKRPCRATDALGETEWQIANARGRKYSKRQWVTLVVLCAGVGS